MRKPFLVAVLVMLATLAPAAFAQGKNELSVLVGRTFVSDQGVIGIAAPDNNLHWGNNITFEANYGRRLMGLGIAALTFEVPFAVNFEQKLHFDVNVIPKDYTSYFLTPSIRANLFPDAGLSPWVSFGGGFGHFSENSSLEFGGTNPGKTGTTTGVFQAGVGLDVKLFRSISVRGEARDFFSGVPELNVDTGKSRQHNYFVAGGVIFHF